MFKFTHITFILVLFLIIMPLKTTGQTQPAEEDTFGEILSLREIKLSPNIENAQFKDFVTNSLYPAWNAHLSGSHFVILEGDRGNRKGQYLALCTYETAKWKAYYDKETSIDQYIQNRQDMQPMKEVWNRFREMVEFPEDCADYRIVGFENYSAMPAVESFGVHNIVVKSGQEKSLENFMRDEWTTSVHIPAYWGFVLKGQNDAARDYIWISAFDPGEMRDGYFPNPGESSPAWEQAMVPVQKQFNQLESYMEYEPGTEGRYTDYFLVE
ncbi:MAG: hypothetical protein GF372_10510 [Candidatus Marinimicrobia bacterium]|nr:hypothetical protein [Candidatus Neomarinimicrobiota bacterium]